MTPHERAKLTRIAELSVALAEGSWDRASELLGADAFFFVRSMDAAVRAVERRLPGPHDDDSLVATLFAAAYGFAQGARVDQDTFERMLMITLMAEVRIGQPDTAEAPRAAGPAPVVPITRAATKANVGPRRRLVRPDNSRIDPTTRRRRGR